MKNLPLGIQTFSEIIRENKLYIDKTKDIYQFFSLENKYYFLSRPRRFGKSLLVSTLAEIFTGNRELFKGLWIYDKIEWKKYPVIRIDFSNMLYTEGSKGFKSSFANELNSIAEKFGIKLKNNNYKESFKELISSLGKKEKVVILIDEYDKPIINFVDNIDIARENREILKNFYETIKSYDEYIKFVFLTGVSKFSKVSVFSGLNNLIDITLDPAFVTITGCTEEELNLYFEEYIKEFARKESITEAELKEELKKWYNGYSWDGKSFVYNLFSILNVFRSLQIKNYWFESATPTYLINLIKKYNIDIKKLEKLELKEYDFSSYEVDNMNVDALLFQTGYLTIKEIQRISISDRKYILSYPNLEVKSSLITSLLNNFIQNRQSNRIAIYELTESLKNRDIDNFFKILISIFGSIPNEIFPESKTTLADKESYYHTIFYLIFKLIGVNINSEVSVSKGRIDALAETNETIYIFEFKVGRSPKKAIEQIEKKEYFESYLASKKQIMMIGVNFSIYKRNIKDYSVKIK